MKEFFDLLIENYGFPSFLATDIMLIIFLVSFIVIIFKAVKKLYERIKKKNIEKIIQKDLHPFFTYQEVFNYTKLYIPQYYQNITPSEGEEPGRIHAAAARSKLMPEFIKKGLLTKSTIKYFIILSDTGMGKTAFLINLYLKYKSIKKGIKYDIRLFPLGAKDILEQITNIKDKKNTILLLDAFDEDIKAVSDYKNRMIEILENVKDFRKIIFTCRTQFFPTKEEEPSDTNDITFGENIKHSIHKLYLSTFDNHDIIKYLIKKYGLNIYNLIRAYRLVRKSPSLMFRPMLLSFIDDLIKQKLYYNFTFEMYSELINNWVKRESSKPAIIKNYGSDKYANSLINFSETLAKDLYIKREERDGYFITLDELKKIKYGERIDANSLTIEDQTGRSLLNRNSIGQYKFAHKSILEYFLALELFTKPEFLITFDFHGMDATQTFYNEMLAKFLSNIEGTCSFSNDNKQKKLSLIIPKEIKILNEINITNAASLNYSTLIGLNHLDKIFLTDPEFKIVYLIYLYICIGKRVDNPKTNSANKNNFIVHINDYKNFISQVSNLRPEMDYNILRDLIKNCKLSEQLKNAFIFLTNPEKISKQFSTNEIFELRELKNILREGVSENVLITNSISNLQKIRNVSNKMNNAKLIY
jgi:hypothetical protein